MIISATSDLHGNLPRIPESDVLCICGDIFPLEYQKSALACDDWLEIYFKKWVDSLPCRRVIVIAGNHDFYFARYGKDIIKERFANLSDKLIYLQDELYEYAGVTFYGCPWCIGPVGWAFCPDYSRKDITYHYDKIPHCDVLLTHQPPLIGYIGASVISDNERREFGSDALRAAVYNKNIKHHFCGHIHTGDHNDIIYPTIGCETIFHNVSLLDEAYKIAFPIKTIEI